MVEYDINKDDEIRDILVVMKRLESTVYTRHRFHSSDDDDDVDELVALWRKMLIGWMYYVVDYCKLQRQSVAAAAFFYDVAIGNNLVDSREEHQLAAATALQLSLKTFDTAVITSEKLVQLGRGLFTKADIVDMEFRTSIVGDPFDPKSKARVSVWIAQTLRLARQILTKPCQP